MVRKLCSIVFSLLIVSSPLAARDTYPRQPGVSIQHYVFALTLNDSTDDIVGEATVSIRFTQNGLTRFFLDLTTAANARGMTVTSVTGDSIAVTFTHAANHLNVTLGRASRAGELRRFTIKYHGIPNGGLMMGTNKYKERCFFSWNWPDKARDWLPMIDHPSAKATSEFIITAPEKYSVVANGLLQSVVSLGDGNKVTHWKNEVPIASWLNAIGVEQFATHYAGMVRGVELQTWVADKDLDRGIATYEDIARRSIEFYSDFIGPYSYEKLANVAAAFGGGGTEHASVIFYGDAGGTRSNTAAPVAARGNAGAAGPGRGAAGAGAAGAANAAAAGRGGGNAGRGGTGRGNGSPGAGGSPGGTPAHEIAHQWFGDGVTESDWDDAWLSEGFATYFTLLYNEHYLGHDTFITGVKGMFTSAIRVNQGLPLVHNNLDVNDLRGVIPQQVYQKGGSVLHMLRGVVGTDGFRNGIREYYKRYQNSNASSDDLRRAFEETSGQDLKWFFEQWLHRPTNPGLDGSWHYDSTSKTLSVDLAQTQTGAAYRLPLEVGITTEGSNTMRVERMEMTQPKQGWKIALDQAPKDVVLDPNTWILMEVSKFVKR